MIDALQAVLDRLHDAYRHGNSLVLLFDYDGTLTPIVDHPQMAVLDRQTTRLLASLAGRPRVHVGILSGRALDELKSLVQLPGLYFAGTGGLELELRKLRILHPQADQAATVVGRLAAQLEKEMAAYPGAWIEKKRFGLTLHYRHLPEQLLGALQAAVAEVTKCFAGEVRTVQGPRAWEITPANGWNKGTAVQLILADLAIQSDFVLYAGDGANDAEGIEAVAGMGGITLGIGPHAPAAAEYRLANHAALQALLARLDASLEKTKSHFAESVTDCLRPHAGWKSVLPTNPTSTWKP
jgi:trehalose-phosphatase